MTAEEREGSQATFLVQRDFETGAARIDWKRDIVRLKFRPYPTLYEYTEILADGTGYVDGIDTSTPTALTKLSDPPGSPMSSVRMIVGTSAPNVGASLSMRSAKSVLFSTI